jgi:hypothetical protein
MVIFKLGKTVQTTYRIETHLFKELRKEFRLETCDTELQQALEAGCL